MKPPGSYKKTQGRSPEIISLVFLSKRWNQKDILKLTDLYFASVFSITLFLGLMTLEKLEARCYASLRALENHIDQ